MSRLECSFFTIENGSTSTVAQNLLHHFPWDLRRIDGELRIRSRFSQKVTFFRYSLPFKIGCIEQDVRISVHLLKTGRTVSSTELSKTFPRWYFACPVADLPSPRQRNVELVPCSLGSTDATSSPTPNTHTQTPKLQNKHNPPPPPPPNQDPQSSLHRTTQVMFRLVANNLRATSSTRVASFAAGSSGRQSARAFSTSSTSRLAQEAKSTEAAPAAEGYELPHFSASFGSDTAFKTFREQQKKLLFGNVTNHNVHGLTSGTKQAQFYRRRGVLGKSGSGRKNAVHYAW
jgi:hypothetical protein